MLKRHAGLALPLAFLGMHQVAEEEQTENTQANLWGEVWQDHVPGTHKHTSPQIGAAVGGTREVI